MVVGFESFRAQFAGYEDCYTIIGGTACDILMNEVDLSFRATQDVDMVVLIENRFAEFATAFWDYIERGGYKCGWKSSDSPHFYRFTEPVSKHYPKMIELFSKRPDFQIGNENIHLTPLPVSEEISSLSAIMLDDEYYRLMLDGRRNVDGVSVLASEYLILFKVKAWLDLRLAKENGNHVNDRDIRKHKNDVFRLFTIVDPQVRVVISSRVANDLNEFLDAMVEENVDLRSLGIMGFSKEEILNSLKEIFILG